MSKSVITQVSLVQELGAIVGSEHAFAPQDERRFAVDDMNPQVLVQPGSYEEVAAVMRFANERGLAVIPRGDGIHMATGNVPRRYDVALSLLRLNQIIEHEPADLTVTCQAGISVEQLGRKLSEAGQMVPLSFSFDPWGTVGGVLAVNSWGPECYAFGFPRDYTIGMRVVTADGRVTRAGGKVVKNVAGYDLCKLYIGSLGTLGLIVEATFKVQPLPKVSTTTVIGCDTLEESCSIAREVLRRGLTVWASRLEHYAWDSSLLVKPYLLWLTAAGTHAGVEQTLREIARLADETGLESWVSPGGGPTAGDNWTKLHSEIEFGEVTGFECRIIVAPDQTADVTAAVKRLGGQLHLSVLPTIGAVRAEWGQVSPGESERRLNDISAIARAYNGSLVVLFCDPELKRKIDVFGEPPPSFELMRRIKQEFDPNGILSPGRFVGRL